MKKFLGEFRTFISKGNVIDLAVAVVIGNAFNAIVSSLVNDVIMPFIGLLIGGIDFSDIKVTLGEANIMFGKFIQNIVDFLIVAFTIFIVVKAFNKLQEKTKKKEAKEEKEEPKKADDIILLEEIRDLLKKNK